MNQQTTGGLQADLERVDPGLLAEIGQQQQLLEALTPMVVASLQRVGELTTRFCDSFAKVHPDVMSMQADTDRERVEDAIGVMTLWKLADQIRDAHPDN